MADRVKRSYRGKTYTTASKRPGRKTVPVKGYCRRPPTSALQLARRAMQQAKEWGF